MYIQLQQPEKKNWNLKGVQNLDFQSLRSSKSCLGNLKEIFETAFKEMTASGIQMVLGVSKYFNSNGHGIKGN